MKIFVTGGTGFLGSHFLCKAIESGVEVIALKRASSTPKIPLHGDVDWLEEPSEEQLVDALRQCSVFVHFLAKGSSPQHATFEDAFAINVIYSLRLWEIAVKAGVKRFIIAGSALEYGSSCQEAIPILPDQALEPVGAYATSKAASSMVARSFCRDNKVKLIYIRCFSLFGEYQYQDNFFPALRKAALDGNDFMMTSGLQVRDFSPVGKAAGFFLKCALRAELNEGEPLFVNFGSGNPKPLIEYATQWWKELGARGNLRPGAIPDRENEPKFIAPCLKKAPVFSSSNCIGV